MSRKQTTQQTPATQAPEPQTPRGWAAERARLATTGLLTRRFAAWADMLALACIEGETSISFAEANARMNRHRKVGPEGAASWRTALQRFAQLDPEGARWRIDAEAGAIVRRDD